MSQNIANLKKKIDIAGDLQSVVQTMKAMAASSIGQYEKASIAMVQYYRTIELGLGVCFREIISNSADIHLPRKENTSNVNIVVFGSDQGLVGQFNDVVTDYALKKIESFSGNCRVWSVGERVHTRLTDTGQSVEKNFSLPSSLKAITPLVGQILLEIMTNDNIHIEKADLHLIYNHRKSGATYKTVSKKLLPLDNDWQKQFLNQPWPGIQLVEVIGNNTASLAALIREYLFVSIFQACAESLASENASRLAAMQRADKNIDELLGNLKGTFNQLRQSRIDEELFDVISGFEALSNK